MKYHERIGLQVEWFKVKPRPGAAKSLGQLALELSNYSSSSKGAIKAPFNSKLVTPCWCLSNLHGGPARELCHLLLLGSRWRLEPMMRPMQENDQS